MKLYAEFEVDEALHKERNKIQGRFSELSMIVATEQERNTIPVLAFYMMKEMYEWITSLTDWAGGNQLDPPIDGVKGVLQAYAPNINSLDFKLIALEALRKQWSHLYINGEYPKEPYPTHFQRDLEMILLGMSMRVHPLPLKFKDQ